MKINEKWIKHWGGHFTLVYDTMLGLHNTTILKKHWGVDLGQALYIYKKNYSFAYYKEKDYKKFGESIAKRLIKNSSLGFKWAKDFVKITDANLVFMKKNMGKDLSVVDYREFARLFNDYSTLHRPIKVVVDFLPKNVLKKILPIFTKVRVHAEPVYENHEKIIRTFTKRIAKDTSYNYEHLLSLTYIELIKYIEKKVLPTKKILAERYKASLIIFNKGKFTLLFGRKVLDTEKVLTKAFEEKVLKGSVAFKGVVRGVVKIVFDPFRVNNFKEGDILVTGMTRPEFLPLMKKAGAFVTDAGGILSHAAITAREMRKPCIIGTQIATKVLKDGDLVEVDATSGIVKILKRK